jgi:hypothetical protein
LCLLLCRRRRKGSLQNERLLCRFRLHGFRVSTMATEQL